METKKILVTPKTAKKYLEVNIKNRSLKDPVVIRYANDMKNGNWKQDTGEFIKISESGVILDGQHRLHAIIKANCSVYLDFIFNLKDEVFDVIDTGASRTASDIFKIDGVKNANIIPSMISFWHLLKTQKISASKKYKLSNADVLREYNKRPDFWQDVARNTISWYQNFSRILPPSWIGGFYALLDDINKEKAYSFIEQLCTGNDLENNCINLLRQKLIQDKLSNKKIKKIIKIAFIIKTWNTYIKGKSISILKYDTEREPFPIPYVF